MLMLILFFLNIIFKRKNLYLKSFIILIYTYVKIAKVKKKKLNMQEFSSES